MKNAIRRMSASALSVACSWSTTTTTAINATIRSPRTVGFIREKKPLMRRPSSRP